MDSPEIALKRDLPTEEEKAGWTNKARSATITIATATSANPESYDIQLDGTADEVEINAAIQSLSGTGGTIVIGEGTVNQSSSATPIDINVNNVRLVGQGASTIIGVGFASGVKLTGVNTSINSLGVRFVTVDGTGAKRMSNCYVSGDIGVVTTAKLTLTNSNVQTIENYGELLLLGVTANELYSEGTLTPPTATDIQKANDIPTVYI